MKLDRFVHSPKGYATVLKSDGVRDDLLRRALLVEAETASHLKRLDVHVKTWADTTVGRSRVGATVAGPPIAVEMEHRVLGGAIDAARR